MVPVEASERAIDPIETLKAALEGVWVAICDAYDVSACMPDIRTLFADADLSQAQQAAVAVLVGMLLEVMESVSRACRPPRTIQLRRSVLYKAEIICELCLQPFRQ